jgi:predicted MFS family arabinose efflux permease
VLVGDLIPVRERQVAMGRRLFAIMTGNLLSAIGAGVVGDLVGWRGVFFATAALGGLVLVIAARGLRGASVASGRFDLSTLVPNYRTIFRNPLAKIFFGAVAMEAIFIFIVRRLSLHRHHAAPVIRLPAWCWPVSASAVRSTRWPGRAC